MPSTATNAAVFASGTKRIALATIESRRFARLMNITLQENLLAADKMAAMRFPQLRVSQLAFLRAIAIKPGSTQTELCQELGVTMSAISRNVDVFGSGKAKSDRHKSFGLVEARRDLDDERLILIYLTDKGRIFLELIEETIYGNN